MLAIRVLLRLTLTQLIFGDHANQSHLALLPPPSSISWDVVPTFLFRMHVRSASGPQQSLHRITSSACSAVRTGVS